MSEQEKDVLTGLLIEEHMELTLADLCRVCTVREESVVALVEEGILTPRGKAPAEWRFPERSLALATKALRLQRDLSVNTAGVAVILELLEEVEDLRARLRKDVDP
jgi:chaperone modulatory protein CbpM